MDRIGGRTSRVERICAAPSLRPSPASWTAVTLEVTDADSERLGSVVTKLVPTSENARRTMRANRAVSRRELAFRKALWAAGARGYRVKVALPGRPDIVFPVHRLAIFVNGCFWHLCPVCNPRRPRGNADFWRNKLEANRARDARVQSQLDALGWEVQVVWEHEIRPDPRPRARQLADQLLRPEGPITGGGRGRTDVDVSSPSPASAAPRHKV